MGCNWGCNLLSMLNGVLSTYSFTKATQYIEGLEIVINSNVFKLNSLSEVKRTHKNTRAFGLNSGKLCLRKFCPG